jgi:hypothetical protein
MHRDLEAVVLESTRSSALGLAGILPMKRTLLSILFRVYYRQPGAAAIITEDYTCFSILNEPLEYHSHRRGQILGGSYADRILLLKMLTQFSRSQRPVELSQHCTASLSQAGLPSCRLMLGKFAQGIVCQFIFAEQTAQAQDGLPDGSDALGDVGTLLKKLA